jgi:hypothetical protein
VICAESTYNVSLNAWGAPNPSPRPYRSKSLTSRLKSGYPLRASNTTNGTAPP